MSADNAILFLSLKDQFRVTMGFAIDNLYYSWSDSPRSESLVLPRIFSYFKKAKSFDNRSDALNYAYKLYNNQIILEYGIVYLDVNKTWLQVLKLAREELNSEKIFVLNNSALKNRTDILENINYTYSDVLTQISKERYAK